MARKFRPGGLARTMLNVGDIDVTRNGEGRIETVRTLRQVDLLGVEEAGLSMTSRLKTKISRLGRWLDMRAEKRESRNELRADRLEQGRLWRKEGLYEKTLHLDLPAFARWILYLFLAGLDFYIFAEAWAVGTDSTTGEAEWWIGGLLGLVVFGAGFLAAVQLKRVVMARRQRELLEEAEQPDPRLVVLAANGPFLALAGTFFLLMVFLGLMVRLTNEYGETNGWMVLMAAMIPLLAAVAELFLYDPMQREELRPNLIDRILSYRLAKLERKLAIREQQIAHARENVSEKYDLELAILRVELSDRGIETDRTVQ